MIDEEKLRQRMQRIADLTQRLDANSRELLEAVMDLHGEALDRIVQRLSDSQGVLDSLAEDPVVSSVLLLYGLHPLDFETRVRRALDKVQPLLRSYGTDAELTGIHGGAIRIRLLRVDSSFTARTVQAAVEEEIYAAAPDATSLVLTGLEKFASPDFVPLETLGILAAGKAGD